MMTGRIGQFKLLSFKMILIIKMFRMPKFQKDRRYFSGFFARAFVAASFAELFHRLISLFKYNHPTPSRARPCFGQDVHFTHLSQALNIRF
jgi:hypothetical protein